MDKIGIDRLKKNFTVIAKLVKAVDSALEDGKVNIAESVGIAFKAVDLIGVVKNLAEAKTELAHLEAQEMTELVAHFREVFELRSKDAEQMVETIMELALQVLFSMEVLHKLKTE